MIEENISSEIKDYIVDLVGCVLRSELEYKEVLIKVEKTVSTAQFNEIKEFILRFTKSYKVNNRKYKDNNTIIIYYKFILNDLTKLQISAIHKNNTYFMDIKDIKIIR